MPRPQSPKSPRGKAKTPPPSRAARSQILILVLSSLVICSLLITAVVTISLGDILGGGADSNPTALANFPDPNQDVLSAQETTVAQKPGDMEAVLLLANMLANSGKLQDAIPYYQKALNLKPGDAAARLDFARALADSDLNNDAELQFRKTIALDPHNQDAHYYLAELYSRWQPPRKREAIAEYQTAFEIDPKTLVGQKSRDALVALGIATPVASPGATPAGAATPAPAQEKKP